MSNDLFARYDLPPLQRIPREHPAHAVVEEAKSVRYARELPVHFVQISAPEDFAIYLKQHIHADIRVDNHQQHVLFHGEKISELNRLIQQRPCDHLHIAIQSARLFADETLFLPSFVSLDGRGAILEANAIDIAILGQESTQIELSNFIIQSPQICGVLLLNCSHGRISNLTVQGSDDYGMILRKHCRYLHIDHCQFRGNRRSGIMLHENTHHVHISHCEVTGIHHSSNWAAGIVITMLESVSDLRTQDAFEPNYFYPNNLDFKIHAVPYRNIIECCHIHHNQSSGIYVDGGNGNILIGNHIAHNDKEGICLDFYAAANVVLYNAVFGNGYRQQQSDHDLAVDFVLEYGRLADHSAAAKLPNISLDNAAYNMILKNTIAEAAGDGIKIVRAGFRNIIGLNSISDNNRGHNSRFGFSGIFLGAAGCEVPNDSSGLDRLPAIENMLFGNHIYGMHEFGIVYDAGSLFNDTLDNFVMKQRRQPILQLAAPNSIVGNNFEPAPPSAQVQQQARRPLANMKKWLG